jgi:transglutaminase-like putative cysteine protease
MTALERRTLAAGLAVTTALAALFPVFESTQWFLRVMGAILAVTGAGLLGRRVRLPRPLQPLLELLVLSAYLAVVFAGGTLHDGLPTSHTVTALHTLVSQSRLDLRRYAPPVAPSAGLVMITAAGVGAVAVLVDLIAVLLDRVVLAGLPLLALFGVPSAVLPGGLGSVPFAIGAIGWLILLLEEGDERVGRWGMPMRYTAPGTRPGGDDANLGRVGRRIGAAAVGLAVTVPVLIPGLDHRLISGHASGNGAGNGSSQATTYNPITRLRDQLVLPQPRQLLVYSTDDPNPDYLRMTTLDVYNGSGWGSSRLEADRDQARVQKGIRPDDVTAPTRSLTLRVAIDHDHLDVHWLPVSFGPRKIDVDGAWLWDPTSQTVFSAARTTKNLSPYTVTADRVLPTHDALELAGNGGSYPRAVQRYTAPIRVSSEVLALAGRLTRGKTTAFDKAIALQDYFTNPANGFIYDLDATEPGPGQDPLDAFLQGKHGFCEQYATAMAALLRVEGIPSRVAVGFTAGQAVRGHRGTYSVTTSDAHAWPEAWFLGSGWVRFEPTPGAVGATRPDYTVPVGAAPGTDPQKHPTPAPSGSAGRNFFDPEKLLKGPSSSSPLATTPTGAGVLWWVVPATLLLLGAAPFCLTRARRRVRRRRIDPLVAWEQLRDDLTDVGLPWHESDSPRTVAGRHGGSVPLLRLATAVEMALYAPEGRVPASDLVADGNAVRRELLASATRGRRWRALVFPPSTLGWAAHGVSERVADAFDLVDRVFALLGRPFRKVLRAG